MREPLRILPLLLAGVVGCGSQAPETPRQLLERLYTAFEALDYDGIVACTSGSGREKEFVRAFVDFANAGREFKAAFLEAYGESGWEELNDPEGVRLDLDFRPVDEALAGVEIEIDGDRAICSAPDNDDDVHLVRREGRWRFSFQESLGATDEQFETNTRFMATFAPLLRSKIGRIGEAGVTPESLDAELGRAMFDMLQQSEQGSMKPK